jgi:hypothetical protein
MRFLLPNFRDRGSGCGLNIASKAGTVDMPYSTGYCSSKAALINLTGCTQKELDAEWFSNIHLYSLHPGGVLSEMTRRKYSNESLQAFPDQASAKMTGWLDMYTDSPHLKGMVCVALATGIAKEALKGKYCDVERDLEDIIAQTEYIKRDPGSYSLGVRFLGSLSNTSQTIHGEDEPFEFPGDLGG